MNHGKAEARHRPGGGPQAREVRTYQRHFGCSEATIRQRFFDSVTKGRAERKITLHQRQYEAADGGNIAMLIWLGKQELGQSDKIEQKHLVRATVVDGDRQRAMLTNERAIDLACDLEAEISRGRVGGRDRDPDTGGVREAGE